MARGRLQLLTIVVFFALIDIAILPSGTMARRFCEYFPLYLRLPLSASLLKYRVSSYQSGNKSVGM